MPGIQFTFEVNDQVTGALEGIQATFEKAFEQDKTLAKFNAGLGQSAEVTKEMGDLAKEVWSEGWGESLEDVTGAIGDVGSQMLDLSNSSPDQIAQVTKGALDLATVMGVDVVEVTRAAGQMMKNGLAPDAQTAFDIIATGAQNGANRSGDLLDTLTQYSANFAEIGIDGPTALGMMNSALDAGIYTTDVAADAMREFGTRILDGSAKGSGAFTTLGLDADLMASKIAAGGPTAKEATDAIFLALGKLTDPVARETAGVALFGTMWEDMGGKSIMAMDPTIAKTKDVAGATEQMGQKLHDTATQKVDVMKRKIDEWVTSMISTQGPFGQIAAFATTFGSQALTLASNIGLIALALKGTALAAGAATLGMRALVIASAPLSVIAGAILAVISLVTVAIERIDTLKRNWAGLMSGNLSQISSFGTFSSLGRVPKMAAGGIVDRPTLAMIGEGNESEAVIPLSKLGQMTGGGSAGGNIYVNVPGGFVGNYDELATRLRDIIVTGQRRGVIDGAWNG